MKQRVKYCPGLVAMICAAISMPSLAERSIQAGTVMSANSSFYKNADEEYYGLPLIIAKYDHFYLQGIDVGYRLFQNVDRQSLALEIRRTFDGYSSDDSDALAGMADRDAAWEAGLAYEVNAADGQAKARIMYDVSDNHGGFSTRFDYERPLWTNTGNMVTWYTGTEYWNNSKTDYYFGVTEAEATSVRPAYVANESYRFYFGSNASRRINARTSLIFSAEYLRVSDAINDSPLTSRQDQWSAYAGIFYQF